MKLCYMLDQVRTTAGSRNQHIARGKGGVLIYIRTSTDYDQTVSKEVLQEAPPSGRGPVYGADSRRVTEEPLL